MGKTKRGCANESRYGGFENKGVNLVENGTYGLSACMFLLGGEIGGA